MNLDPRDWKSDKPQCVHHNDADSCYACGTGRVSSAYNANIHSTGDVKPYYQYRCATHGIVGQCWACDFAATARVERLREVVGSRGRGESLVFVIMLTRTSCDNYTHLICGLTH
jgi:hypothetical protein